MLCYFNVSNVSYSVPCHVINLCFSEAVESDQREMVSGETEAQAQVVELATIEANESNNIIILPPSCIILNV